MSPNPNSWHYKLVYKTVNLDKSKYAQKSPIPSHMSGYILTILFAPLYFTTYYGIAAVLVAMLIVGFLVVAIPTALIAFLASFGPKVSSPDPSA